jgi:RimJ/RimL family protein N-acetyltransferase
MEIDMLRTDLVHKEDEVYLIRQDFYREEILEHFKSLSDDDRYSRFGMKVSDDFLETEYGNVNKNLGGFGELRVFIPVDFISDSFCFAIFKDKKIIGLLQLIKTNEGSDSINGVVVPSLFRNNSFELGISVSTEHQGKGIGSKLFEKGVSFAKTIGARTITTYCLASNVAVQKMARKNGLSVLFEGTERVGNLAIPPGEALKNPSEMFSNFATAIESNNVMFFDVNAKNQFYMMLSAYQNLVSLLKWNSIRSSAS